MPIEKLQRVMWRIRTNHPNTARITLQQLINAVTREIGYDMRTFKRIKLALARLGWIKSYGKRIRVTGKDLTET